MTEQLKPSLTRDFKNLRKIWPYLTTQKLWFTVSVVVIPIISLLQIAQPLLLKDAIDQGITPNNQSQLIIYSTLFLGTILLEYVSRIGQLVATNITIGQMILTLRKTMVDHILRLSAKFHDKSLSGSLVTRATSDFDNLSESLNQGVLQSLVDIFVLISCMVGMFILNWQMALMVLMILPFLLWAVKWFSQAIKDSLLSARVHLASLNGFTQECLFGIATIKTINGEEKAQEKYQELSEKFRKSQMTSVSYDALLFSILDGMAAITIGLTLWVISKNFFSAPLSSGLIIAFVRYIQQIFDPLKQLGSTMSLLQGVFTSIDRIFTILEEKEFISGDQKPVISNGHVRFSHVGFAYGQDTILKDVSFDLKTGDSLAIVGRTGSGKTTIIRLLAKLYEGYTGSIHLDGHDLAHMEPFWLRKQIAMVPQDIILFAGSIRYNIGLERDGVDDDKIRHAIALVGASFIDQLPGQLDFVLTEQGNNLSHGQRQLIVFARALASDPALIILDEATSVVDQETEAIIQKAFEKIIHNKTVIVIAHRLSTVQNCTNIMLLDKGEVLELGTHETLLADQKSYFDLFHGK